MSEFVNHQEGNAKRWLIIGAIAGVALSGCGATTTEAQPSQKPPAASSVEDAGDKSICHMNEDNVITKGEAFFVIPGIYETDEGLVGRMVFGPDGKLHRTTLSEENGERQLHLGEKKWAYNERSIFVNPDKLGAVALLGENGGCLVPGGQKSPGRYAQPVFFEGAVIRGPHGLVPTYEPHDLMATSDAGVYASGGIDVPLTQVLEGYREVQP